MEPAQKSRWIHVPELDGLRALAIVAVMLHHFVPMTFNGGYFGVTVFFVLSGYLITSLLLSEWNNRGRIDLRAFYIRRALRLYPALGAVVLGFTLVALLIGHPGVSSQQFLAGDGTSLIYVNDFVQAAGALGGGSQWFAPTWSLGVEEQFYLLCPLILVLLLRGAGRPRIGQWLLVATLAVAMLYPALVKVVGTGWMYFSPLGSLLPLLAGCSTAFFRYHPRALLTVLAAVLLIVAMLEAPWVSDPSLWSGYAQLVTFCAAILILFLTSTGFAPMRWRPLVWLGRRSYGVYLVHMPMFYTLLILLPQRNQWFYAVATATASIVTAGLLYRYLEAPFLAMKRRFAAVPEAATSTELPVSGIEPADAPSLTHNRRAGLA